MIHRRFHAAGLLLGMLVCGSGAVAAGQRAVRPDILLIMPDQMRGDCLSIVGHPVVRTPNLDRLAEQGMLFRRAYSTVASCIPARYALMTGLCPQTSGVVGFGKKPIDSPTLPRLLHDAGYRTVLAGREMHQIADASGLGYDTAVLGSTYVSGDEYAEDVERAFPQIGQFRQWVEKGLGLSYNHWQAAPWPLADQWHPTSWVVRQAREVVSEVPQDQPLFLTASFYAPHPPLFPPQIYYDRCLARELPAPAHGDWVDWSELTARGAEGGHRVLLEGETLRKAQAGYFGLIEHIDHEVAPLVAEFCDRSRKAGRPWLVVLTSDHGEMLGDHGYFRKCEPFEGSANIPFVICGSGDLGFAAGRRCFEPVCLEDLLPTFVELAGATCPKVDGISLVGVLRGKQVENPSQIRQVGRPRAEKNAIGDEPAIGSKIRPWLHFEHATCYSKGQAYHALTDGRIKYIWRPLDGREHLFDLQADPREQHDLAADAQYGQLLNTWRRVLVERLAPRPEGFSDGQRLVPGRPYAAINAGVR